jgi:hypothetical protein
MKANQAAFEVGQLAERMAQGYYAYITVIAVSESTAQWQVTTVPLVRFDCTSHEPPTLWGSRFDRPTVGFIDWLDVREVSISRM